MTERDHLLSEELLMVRHSGEIPEIAFHSSIHFLTADPEGPGLELTELELDQLRCQVVARYREIMLRDLDPANRDSTIYRGLKRCMFNWERLGKFWRREALSEEEILRQEIAQALVTFLQQESAEVRSGQRQSCLNCSGAELLAFARLLGIGPQALPEEVDTLCCRCEE